MSFKCPLCPKTYKKEGWLRRHMRDVHGAEVTEKTTTSSDPPVETQSYDHDMNWLIRCPYCGHTVPEATGCIYCGMCLDTHVVELYEEKQRNKN